MTGLSRRPTLPSMTRSWTTLDAADTPDGRLELRQRGEDDFLITLDGRILMNSRANRSELALGELAAQATSPNRTPRILIGGLGMGCTLRAALDALPPAAEVVVAEINADVVRWCAGPLGPLTAHSTSDDRVQVELSDVSDSIAAASQSGKGYDAIALDLYEGPHQGSQSPSGRHFTKPALLAMRRALRSRGTLAVWTEHRDAAFERQLRSAGFSFEVQRPGRGGLRHAIYLARSR